MLSSKPEDQAVVDTEGAVMTNQQSYGTHMNIAGGAMAKHAKNTAAAQKFLEYLASPQAQAYFANGNNEWPVVPGIQLRNAALDSMGNFKRETIPVSAVAGNIAKVQQMLDQVGFK